MTKLKNLNSNKTQKLLGAGAEIMDQAWAGSYKPGQQQSILFTEWQQDKMTVSKKYTPPRD